MTRYLITGGAGFIGSAMVRRLIAEGAEVTVIDKLTYAGNLDNLEAVRDQDNYCFVKADIADAGAMAAAVDVSRPDRVVHFAAESHVDRSIDGPEPFIQTNVVGSLRVLQAALAHWQTLDGAAKAGFRLLHVSTDEVYGSLGETGAFDESSPYRPNSPYAASKASADHLARSFHRTYGLPVLVSNCGNNYGLYQFPEKLIPLMILNGRERRPLPVYGAGDNVRDWIHVDDHVAALLCALQGGEVGETYLIGGRCQASNRDIVERICAILDARDDGGDGFKHATLMQSVDDRPGHDFRYAIDPTKIERQLGWRPAIDFQAGLEATVSWYADNPEWCRRLADRYDRRRLGLAAGAPA
jgi:dTDP-glucose 4,6-dehydratase